MQSAEHIFCACESDGLTSERLVSLVLVVFVVGHVAVSEQSPLDEDSHGTPAQ